MRFRNLKAWNPRTKAICEGSLFVTRIFWNSLRTRSSSTVSCREVGILWNNVRNTNTQKVIQSRNRNWDDNYVLGVTSEHREDLGEAGEGRESCNFRFEERGNQCYLERPETESPIPKPTTIMIATSEACWRNAPTSIGSRSANWWPKYLN